MEKINDQNIKNILESYDETCAINLKTENVIMKEILTKKDYSKNLKRYWRIAKKGMILSAVLLITYFVVTFIEMPVLENITKDSFKNPVVNLIAVILVVILYLPLLLNIPELKKRLSNQ